MKRLGLILLFLAGIAIAAAFILPAVIPTSAYRDRVESATADALNRDVSLAGEVSLTILPRVQVVARDVSIANAQGFGEEPFAQMREMRVGVRLMPLFSRRIEITEFVLVDPAIRLQQRGGMNNWTFAPDDTAPAPAGEGFRRRPGALPIEASFGDVRIENASIFYSDGSQTREITGLDMAIDLPSLDEPTGIEGSLSADGEALSFNARLGSIRDFFEGRETPLALTLGGDLVDVAFDGRIPASEQVEFAGAFSADIPSIRALARFTGTDMPPGENLEVFSTRGRIQGRPGLIALTADSIRLDAVRGSGNLTADLSGRRPSLTGRLVLPELDVNPYLPEPAGAASTTGGGIPPWGEEQIDLAGLGLADADLSLSVGRLQFRDIVVTDAALRTVLSNRRLQAELQNFALYDGLGRVTAVVNARQATPSYSLDAQLNGLDALPFLEAAAGFDRLAGTGTMALALSATGGSQAAIMRSLDGNGNFSFADGAIVGINIAETIRNVGGFVANARESGLAGALAGARQSDSEQASVGETQTTDFTSLTGSFSLADGRATQPDLLMLSPLLRVEGQGWVNLADQTLDYRLRPRAVASIEGQGGSTDMRGITVPIRFQGDFNNLRYGVDTEAVARAALQGALSGALGGDTSRSPEDAVRDTLLDAIGLRRSGQSGNQTGEEAQEEPDPASLLRGLFDRGRSENEEESPDEPNRG
jgi:AsmA protein